MVQELLGELRLVLRGKTLDTLLPPILFVLSYSFLELNPALFVALVAGGVIFLLRLYHKHTIVYAMFGLLGVLIAFLFAFISGTASNYYLPSIISSAVVLLLTFFSLLFKKPLALWLSHLTRNFPIEWYQRRDVLPAYQEVTIGWLVLLSLRFFILLGFFLEGDAVRYGIFNVLLGLPATIVALLITYIYGVWRLQKLGGPSVDEFKQNAPPPWESQKKGF